VYCKPNLDGIFCFVCDVISRYSTSAKFRSRVQEKIQNSSRLRLLIPSDINSLRKTALLYPHSTLFNRLHYTVNKIYINRISRYTWLYDRMQQNLLILAMDLLNLAVELEKQAFCNGKSWALHVRIWTEWIYNIKTRGTKSSVVPLTKQHASVRSVSYCINMWWQIMSLPSFVQLDDCLRINWQLLVWIYDHTK